MDEQTNDTLPQDEQIHTPRPAWQVWGARVLLIVFLALLFMYYVNLMRGGL